MYRLINHLFNINLVLLFVYLIIVIVLYIFKNKINNKVSRIILLCPLFMAIVHYIYYYEIHYMKLHNDPFNLIKSGTKTIELRLNDLKRQKIKVDDLIEFTNRITDEKMVVRVVDLIKFNNFSDLYKNISKVSMGYREDEDANPSDMELYYSLEEQEKYGVLAIKIEMIDK